MGRIVIILLVVVSFYGIFSVRYFFTNLRTQSAVQPNKDVEENLRQYARKRQWMAQKLPEGPLSGQAAGPHAIAAIPPTKVQSYDYSPLSEDLGGGAKGFVDRYMTRLRRVEGVPNKEEQSRILGFLELQLFLLGTERLLNPKIQSWARSELDTVKKRTGNVLVKSTIQKPTPPKKSFIRKPSATSIQMAPK